MGEIAIRQYFLGPNAAQEVMTIAIVATHNGKVLHAINPETEIVTIDAFTLPKAFTQASSLDLVLSAQRPDGEPSGIYTFDQDYKLDRVYIQHVADEDTLDALGASMPDEYEDYLGDLIGTAAIGIYLPKDAPDSPEREALKRDGVPYGQTPFFGYPFGDLGQQQTRGTRSISKLTRHMFAGLSLYCDTAIIRNMAELNKTLDLEGDNATYGTHHQYATSIISGGEPYDKGVHEIDGVCTETGFEVRTAVYMSNPNIETVDINDIDVRTVLYTSYPERDHSPDLFPAYTRLYNIVTIDEGHGYYGRILVYDDEGEPTCQLAIISNAWRFGEPVPGDTYGGLPIAYDSYFQYWIVTAYSFATPWLPVLQDYEGDDDGGGLSAPVMPMFLLFLLALGGLGGGATGGARKRRRHEQS